MPSKYSVSPPVHGRLSGAMSFMPLKPLSRALPMCHSGPAVCPRKKASTSVADSVTMPKNTPPTRPQIMK